MKINLFCSFLLFTLIAIFVASPLSLDPTTLNFIDSQGRERIFHGVNIVMKTYPYHPIPDQFHPKLSFTTEDMEKLEEWGLNIIRLGTQWPGYEPERGIYNETYLNIIEDLVNRSSAHNILSLIDFHQDILNEKFCGEGIPTWAVKEPESAWAFPRPLQISPFVLDEKGIPSKEDCEKHDWPSYHFAYQTAQGFQSLYDNVDGIQDSFGMFWQKVADRFKNNDNVVGYELINEPFAGNVLTNPLRLIPGYADSHNLMNMYDNLNKNIRSVDNQHIVFFESVTWDDFISMGFDHVPGGELYANRSAISYHYYDQVNFHVTWQVNARLHDRERLKCGSMCTEFGICMVSDADFDGLTTQLEEFDLKQQSWIGWSYKPFGDITGDCGNIYDDQGNLNLRLVHGLSRTYAQAVAGKTKNMKFDNNTKEFVLQYEICEKCGETEIYINEELHYNEGFSVEIDNKDVMWYQPKKNRVHLKINGNNGVKNGDVINVNIKRKGTPTINFVELGENKRFFN